MEHQQEFANPISDNVALSATNEKPEHTYKRCTESELIELRLDWVIAAGVRAFPVEKGGKRPLVSNNLDRATSDPDMLRRWAFEKFPGCNFGIVMGDGLYCLDVDRHRPDEDGFSALRQLGGELSPSSFYVATPRNGVHLYFRSGSAWKTKKLRPGLDFRGEGSYCVSPWSLNDHGIYVPHGDIRQLAEIPEWLLHRLEVRGPARVDRYTISRRPQRATPSGRLIKLEKHLSRINPSLPRNDWRDVIYASLNCWGFCEEVVTRLRDWSAASPDKWDPAHFESIIDSFNPARIDRLGLRAILKTKATYPVSRWSEIPVQSGYEGQVREIASCIAREAEAILTGHGNLPTEIHRTALHAVAGPLAQALYSREGRFRKAFPLATGLGKTTLCQALCKVISDKALDKSVAIFVERVPEAGELKACLLQLGVSPNLVGIVHAHDKYVEEFPPIKLDDAYKYPFVIACHARARTPRVDRLLNFRGAKRDVTIWDESLIRSSAYHLDKGDAFMAAGVWLDTYGALTDAGRHSVRYAENVEALLTFLAETRTCLKDAGEGIVELPVSRNAKLPTCGN